MVTILDNLTILLQYPFVRRALFAGPLIAVCAALLGITLVTGRKAMIGDGLSHVSFCAVAAALAVGIAPMVLSLPAVIITAVLLLRGSDRKNAEASVALVSGGALAVGTFILSMVRGMNMDVSDYMFGSIFTLSSSDTVLCVLCSVTVIFAFVILLRRIFSVSFDRPFSMSSGIRVRAYEYVTAVLTAVTVVVGMKLMGVMLVTALIVFPALSAMEVCRSYGGTVLFTAVSSVVCFEAGIFVSLLFSFPAGATVVISYLLLLIICSALKTVKAGTSGLRMTGTRAGR